VGGGAVLHEVVLRALLEHGRRDLVVVAARQHRDGDRCPPADLAVVRRNPLAPVHVGQVVVEQDAVGAQVTASPQSVLAGGRLVDHVAPALPLQQSPHHQAVVWIILHEEDRSRRCHVLHTSPTVPAAAAPSASCNSVRFGHKK